MNFFEQSTTEDYSPPPKATPELNAMQLSPGYSAGSSSGYSSPRSSNESKSPTPEPLGAHNADVSAESGQSSQSSQSSLNVTVIRIDPTSTSNQIWVLWFYGVVYFILFNVIGIRRKRSSKKVMTGWIIRRPSIEAFPSGSRSSRCLRRRLPITTGSTRI